MLGRARRVQGRTRFADCPGMRQDATFGRILDEKLEREGLRFGAAARQHVEDDRYTSWESRRGPVFLFGDIPAGFSAAGDSWTSAYPRPAAPRPAPAPRKPARRLTDAQRRALETLRAAGATDLTADFSEAELKSAYRALARRFHPDRHPLADAPERARLARTFSSMSDAYRELSRIFMN